MSSNYSERVCACLCQLRVFDPTSYPRELHHSYLVARALDGVGHVPILEADYWWNHFRDDGRTRVARPRVDVWCSSAFGDSERELFVEIKLAGIGGKRSGVGTLPQRHAVGSWALDIWRLLVGTNRAHCAFVLCAFGDAPGPWVTANDSGTLSVVAELSADEVYEKLSNARGDTAGDAITAFLDQCGLLLGAKVTRLAPTSNAAPGVWSAAVEWLQDAPFKSDWVAMDEGSPTPACS
jgi:hypothetical protein